MVPWSTVFGKHSNSSNKRFPPSSERLPQSLLHAGCFNSSQVSMYWSATVGGKSYWTATITTTNCLTYSANVIFSYMLIPSSRGAECRFNCKRDDFVFFNSHSQQKHLLGKKNLIKRFIWTVNSFFIRFKPPACLAVSIDIKDVILNIRLWHGNSLILKYKLFNVEKRHENTFQ